MGAPILLPRCAGCEESDEVGICYIDLTALWAADVCLERVACDQFVQRKFKDVSTLKFSGDGEDGESVLIGW